MTGTSRLLFEDGRHYSMFIMVENNSVGEENSNTGERTTAEVVSMTGPEEREDNTQAKNLALDRSRAAPLQKQKGRQSVRSQMQ